MAKTIDMEIIIEENKKVIGTSDYSKYKMATYGKRENGTWFFMGWYTPNEKTAILKKVKNNLYLITENVRYTVNDDVRKLIEIQL